MNNINTSQLEAFSKIGQKATKKASLALEKLVQHQSFINLSETIITSPSQFYAQFGNADSEVFTTAFQINGDLKGYILVIWNLEQAIRMGNHLTVKQSSNLTTMAQSSLEELANIVMSNFLTELSQETKLKIIQSPPESITDMLKATLDEIGAAVAQESENALLLTTQFEILPIKASAFFTILLEAKSGNKLLENITNE